MTELELQRNVRNLGWKSINEIIAKLAEHGERLAPVRLSEPNVQKPYKTALDQQIRAAAHTAGTQEKIRSGDMGDALHRQALASCHSIPGFDKLSLEEANKLYDLVKKAISQSCTQNMERM